MAHGGQEDPRDERYSGGTYPYSADASQYRLSENEPVEGPPQSTAPLSSQYLGYGPWSAPPPHPGVQEPCYGVSCANGGASGNGALHDATASQYGDKGAGTAVPYHWDNGNSTGTTCVYAPPLASNSQANHMAGQGPTPAAASVHPGAGTSAQPYGPAIDVPVPSESLMSLARRLILDQGTRVNVLNMEASGCGGIKVTITLETADII